MRKKILHLVYSFGIGGLENVIANLIRHSDSSLVEHSIVSLTDERSLYTEELAKLANFYCLNKKEGHDLLSHKTFYQLLKKIKPDVVNTYNFGTMEYQLVAAFARVPRRVHSDHGYGGDDSSGTSKKRNFVRRFVSNFVHAHIVVSPDLLEWVTKVLRVPRYKLLLIYNGIDINKFSPSKVSKSNYSIATVGRADPVKNHSLLIHAYVKACQSNRNLRQNSVLRIAGDGPSFEGLEQLKQQAGKEYNIELLGFRRDIDNILKSTHLFALSSVYEAMPMTILEAMACAVPVVSTDVGGVSNLLSEKQGWLVESQNINQMADIFIEAFENPDDAEERGNNGRRLVEERYSVLSMVNEYMKIYGVN